MGIAFEKLPMKLQEQIRRDNPSLIVPVSPPVHSENPKEKRVRQSTKSLMNKLESEWFAIINMKYPNYPRPRAQAKTYRLANGVRYTPDFTASSWPTDGGYSRETAWEVKGKHSWDDALVKLKVAATTWPEVQWILVWKNESGEWQQQEVLP